MINLNNCKPSRDIERGELFAEIASLRKKLEQSKEQELLVEIEKLKAHIEESKDLEVQKDITEIRQILEPSNAERHVIVNSNENIRSSPARLTLPALSHFSGVVAKILLNGCNVSKLRCLSQKSMVPIKLTC